MIRIILMLGILSSGVSERLSFNFSDILTSRLGDFIQTGRWMELFEQGGRAEKVGEGSFGVAKRAKLAPECNSPKPIVVKEIDLANYQRKMRMSLHDSIKAIANELKTQMHLGNHPNVMGIYDFAPRDFQDWTDQVYIMMPEARGGDLDKLYETELRMNGIDPGANKGALEKFWGQMLDIVGMKEDHQKRNSLIAHIAVDVTRGLKHIHEAGFIHMDIKPGNVWASDMGCLHQPLGCKFMLGDFGLTMTEKAARGVIGGTPFFMPPEVGGAAKQFLYGPMGAIPPKIKGWSKAGDVFSLGLTLLFLISMKGESMWEDFRGSIMTKPASVLEDNVEGLPPLLSELISRMVLGDPSKRVTAAEAHDIALRAYMEVTGSEAVMPTVYAIPSCITQCNALKCCHMHHCSIRKRTCQLDKPRKEKGYVHKALSDALGALRKLWTASAAATPVLKELVCYGHNMAPPGLSKDKRQPTNASVRPVQPSKVANKQGDIPRTPIDVTVPFKPERAPQTPVVVPEPHERLNVTRPLHPARENVQKVQPDILRKGSAVKYYSSSYRQWIDCAVLNTRKSAADSVDIELDCKAGYWMNPDEQAQKVRAIKLAAPKRELPGESPPRYTQGTVVQYFAASQGTWIDCTVVGVQPPQISLDCRPGLWLSLEDQRMKVRERPSPPTYDVGSEVQYHSVSANNWIGCRVTAKQADQVQLDCKQGYWFPLAEQQAKLQPRYKSGDRVRYHSVSQGKWIPCGIVSSDQAGSVWLSENCGSGFLDVGQQKLKLAMQPRMRSMVKLMPMEPRMRSMVKLMPQ
eukprot:TRINITY_DN4023_c0_g1_i1.p1 TRINITY_DN4023_c0_g1~~TRINITY_DN4023_c0_g1_i1.p1  ORF type:complete len:801 (-),score=48.32 TRINITY_DN4023_c0_g1_i1:61-2463(-)